MSALDDLARMLPAAYALLVCAVALSAVVLTTAAAQSYFALKFLRSLSPRQTADLLDRFFSSIPFLPKPRSIPSKRPGSDLYLRRFYLTPHWFRWRVWLHYIAESDEDRDLHTHPWNFATLILANGYEEFVTGGRTNKRVRGSLAFRSAEDAHRVRLFLDDEGNERPTWTLMIAGQARREWGFVVDGFSVPWRTYLGLPPNTPEHGEDEVRR